MGLLRIVVGEARERVEGGVGVFDGGSAVVVLVEGGVRVKESRWRKIVKEEIWD